MYIIIILVLLASGAALAVNGAQKRRFPQALGGALLAGFTLFFFWFMGFWGEMLWFDALGYGERFWVVAIAKAALALATAVFGCLVLHLLTFTVPKERRGLRIGSRLLGALIGGMWGYSQWDTILQYWNRVPTDLKDPIIGKDTAFYLFTLPFYDILYNLLFLLAATALITLLASSFVRIREEEGAQQIEIPARTGRAQVGSLYITAAIFLLVLAWGKYLNRYHLLYSPWGAVTGAGWTDANIRLPAYGIVAALTAAVGLLLALPPTRRRLPLLLGKRSIDPQRLPLYAFGAAGAAVGVIWIAALTLIPGLFQWLRVEPNEITFERPFIEHNIRFTRHGFKLQGVEEREFPAEDRFTQQMVRDNRSLFTNIRLWDHRALDAVYKQFQEIRLYYEFEDVDIDRYTIGEAYRQVMVSARELELSNLPPDSQTFVNRRFKYTHGYGITLTPVSEFTTQGLPNLLIKDIPPKSEHPDLEIRRPEIYFGELTTNHVVVNTEEEELDYPSGEENVYTRYTGRGGVRISNLWRKFLFGWKFDGTRLFLSGYPRSESRIMFHRRIQERIRTLAPFLRFDDDPYIVMAEGRLYWIIDGYTSSRRYPYSEPFATGRMIKPGLRGRGIPNLFARPESTLEGANYIRNSVKVVVDAFHGSVDFYIFEPDDPLIRVWSKIFPHLFKGREEMPQTVQAHIRYPADMLLTQGLVYAKYHMTDSTVFYNQEDLWVRATEKYYNRVQPVEPYYIMWEPPGRDTVEFVLILPFTPKNKQVLIGWIAGMCDPGSYGQVLAYKFPKEKRILGPQQFETKIDQDRFLSGQLTLWDQRGSSVIRGNVLAIPVEETLFYVEPIYLQAETAAYPELRLVIVMHQDTLSYGETFDEALRGLFPEEQTEKERPAEAPAVGRRSVETLVQGANQAFEDYLRHLGDKRFDDAAAALTALEERLEELQGEVGGRDPGAD